MPAPYERKCKMEVKIGQIWRSMDYREGIRGDLVVLEIGKEEVYGELYATVENLDTGRISEIRCDRMKPGSRGYELIRDVRKRRKRS